MVYAFRRQNIFSPAKKKEFRHSLRPEYFRTVEKKEPIESRQSRHSPAILGFWLAERNLPSRADCDVDDIDRIDILNLAPEDVSWEKFDAG